MKLTKRRIGLSLSGGGYRAAAFHLGTLNKLNELGILNNIDVVSTISSGSITGAAWCLHQGDFASFHQQMKEDLHHIDFIKYIFRSPIFMRFLLFALFFIGGALVLSFTSYSWAVFPLLILFFYILLTKQFKIFPVSAIIEEVYNQYFHHKTLKDLKPRPVLAIGSSNLHSGRPFTFRVTKCQIPLMLLKK